MITRNRTTWQNCLKEMTTSISDLLTQLNLSPEQVSLSQEVAKTFPLRVPQGFISRMKKGDPNDPLLTQVLPITDELKQQPGFIKDPLQEAKVNPIPGLLHKYHGRVLLTLAPSCAINCRYCFRRHFPYEENNPGRQGWDDALVYIADDTSIEEVIYSGGEPLLQSDEALLDLNQKISKIPHVKRIRIHTRMPVVIPERITEEFIHAFTQTRLKTILVIHSNHANEIDDAVAAAMQRLTNANILLLNQSVLLKGVNDSEQALVELSLKLFDANVLPYYLHLLDKVEGAAHFDVDEVSATQLMKLIANKLPGYLVPRLVKETSGMKAKQFT